MTGESGVCTFSWYCRYVANGVYIGNCMDRFFIGTCCQIPDNMPDGGYHDPDSNLTLGSISSFETTSLDISSSEQDLSLFKEENATIKENSQVDTLGEVPVSPILWIGQKNVGNYTSFKIAQESVENSKFLGKAQKNIEILPILRTARDIKVTTIPTKMNSTFTVDSRVREAKILDETVKNTDLPSLLPSISLSPSSFSSPINVNINLPILPFKTLSEYSQNDAVEAYPAGFSLDVPLKMPPNSQKKDLTSSLPLGYSSSTNSFDDTASEVISDENSTPEQLISSSVPLSRTSASNALYEHTTTVDTLYEKSSPKQLMSSSTPSSTNLYGQTHKILEPESFYTLSDSSINYDPQKQNSIITYKEENTASEHGNQTPGPYSPFNFSDSFFNYDIHNRSWIISNNEEGNKQLKPSILTGKSSITKNSPEKYSSELNINTQQEILKDSTFLGDFSSNRNENMTDNELTTTGYRNDEKSSATESYGRVNKSLVTESFYTFTEVLIIYDTFLNNFIGRKINRTVPITEDDNIEEDIPIKQSNDLMVPESFHTFSVAVFSNDTQKLNRSVPTSEQNIPPEQNKILAPESSLTFSDSFFNHDVQNQNWTISVGGEDYNQLPFAKLNGSELNTNVQQEILRDNAFISGYFNFLINMNKNITINKHTTTADAGYEKSSVAESYAQNKEKLLPELSHFSDSFSHYDTRNRSGTISNNEDDNNQLSLVTLHSSERNSSQLNIIAQKEISGDNTFFSWFHNFSSNRNKSITENEHTTVIDASDKKSSVTASNLPERNSSELNVDTRQEKVKDNTVVWANNFSSNSHKNVTEHERHMIPVETALDASILSNLTFNLTSHSNSSDTVNEEFKDSTAWTNSNVNKIETVATTTDNMLFTQEPINIAQLNLSLAKYPWPALKPTTERAGSYPFETTSNLNVSNVCGRSKSNSMSKIVGSHTSHNLRWPWMVSLRILEGQSYSHKCGAALLNQLWAVTAAHCVYRRRSTEILLRLGEYNFDRKDDFFPYVDRGVHSVVVHPHFDAVTFENDIALLRFDESVRFQVNIIPVCLPEFTDNFEGRTAKVTGWGRLSEAGKLPVLLHEATMPIMTNEECQKMFLQAGYSYSITDVFLCAGRQNGGLDSCHGDSGGPMVIPDDQEKWTLIGLISWGEGCDVPQRPVVYTRISKFVNWIENIIF